jgi:cytoskeletal protein RodZ
VPLVLVPSARMRTGLAILGGLLAGILVATGILVAFVFVGPDPITPSAAPTPTLPPVATPSASLAPSPSATPSPSLTPSPSFASSPTPSASVVPSGSAAPPSGSAATQTGFHVGEPAPPLVVPQLGGETIDLAGAPRQRSG